MSELFETINANANEAMEREQAEVEAKKAQEAADAALAKWRAQEAQRRKNRRIRATVALVIRAILAVVAWAVLGRCYRAGLVDVRLAGAAVIGSVSWLSVWAGGWLQFMFCEGGVFRGSSK